MITWNTKKLTELQDLRNDGLTVKQIADRWNIKPRTVGYGFERLHTLQKQGRINIDVKTKKPKQSINKNGSISSSALVTIKDGEKMDEKKLLKAHGLDADRFTIERYTSNVWGKPAAGQTSYQTKITVKPVTFNLEDVIKSINKDIKPLPKQRRTVKPSSKNTIVLPLFDLHFGISTYETLKPYLEQIADVLSTGYRNAVIVLGGDYFHSDKMTKAETVKGTQLDPVDMVTAINDGTRFFDELMDLVLKTSSNVFVISVPGNHDQDLSYVWGAGMKEKYKKLVDSFNITLGTSAAFNVDACGFLIAHGDVSKNRLPLLFATEYKPIWSKTKYHAVLWGHFHKETLTDDQGVVCFQVGTPKDHDRWEKRKGFVMSRRKLELLEFNRDRLTAIHYLES